MPSRYATASSSLVDGSPTSSCRANRKSSRSARASIDAPLRGPPSRYRSHCRDEGPGGSLRALARDDVGSSPQPLSAPLQAGIRFFRLPLPASTSAFLAVGLPTMGADTGLPCSARITGRVRSCLSAGRVSVRAALSRQAGPPFSAPFWPEPKLSPDGSLKPNDAYQHFTYVDRT